MKAIVEFGKPQNALKNQNMPCGVSGQFVCESPTKANQLAKQIFHVMSERSEDAPEFNVKRDTPRLTVWANDRSFWVSVSLLDGVMRGSYAGTTEAK